MDDILRDLYTHTAWNIDDILIDTGHQPGDDKTETEHKQAVEGPRLASQAWNHFLMESYRRFVAFHGFDPLRKSNSLDVGYKPMKTNRKSTH